ncbi:MAG: sel1 repeat family protein [Acidimicrobiia bacterium]|nr:sel1 repeat family protein [Acidimicrobiia bacterium]
MAAEQGIAQAMSNLGLLYNEGRGVPHDDAEAVRLFQLAAERGLPEAMHNLGGPILERRGRSQKSHLRLRLVQSRLRDHSRFQSPPRHAGGRAFRQREERG